MAFNLPDAAIGAIIGACIGSLATFIGNIIVKLTEHKQISDRELAKIRVEKINEIIELLISLQREDRFGIIELRDEANKERLNKLNEMGETFWFTAKTGYYMVELSGGIHRAIWDMSKASNEAERQSVGTEWADALRRPIADLEHDLWGELLNAYDIDSLRKRHKLFSPEYFRTKKAGENPFEQRLHK